MVSTTWQQLVHKSVRTKPWLQLRRIYVLFSRLDLWREPTREQAAFIERFRTRIVEGTPGR